MSKFCMQCGKKIEDNDMHCQFCGASQDTGFNNSPPPKKKKSNDLLVPIVAICSIILVIIIVIANLTIFNKGYKKPIDKLFDAIESGDIDDLEDALPEFYIDSDDFDKKYLKAQLKKVSSLMDDSDISYDYEEIDKESIDDDELKKHEKGIKERYDEKVDIDKGYDVKILMTAKIGKLETSNEMTFKVYRIDGEWCITDTSIPDLV